MVLTTSHVILHPQDKSLLYSILPACDRRINPPIMRSTGIIFAFGVVSDERRQMSQRELVKEPYVMGGKQVSPGIFEAIALPVHTS